MTLVDYLEQIKSILESKIVEVINLILKVLTMKILEELEQLKAELKEKWLDYYEINQTWIKVAAIHKGHTWTEVINGTNTTLYCPDSKLIIGVVSDSDPRVSEFIQVSTQFSGTCNLDKIVEALGLRFDPDVALAERAEAAAKLEEAKLLAAQLQETKLSVAITRPIDDLGLDKLRKEINN